MTHEVSKELGKPPKELGWMFIAIFFIILLYNIGCLVYDSIKKKREDKKKKEK